MGLALKDLVKEARATANEIPPDVAWTQLEADEISMVIDVREPSEFAEQHVPGAVNVPRGVLELRAAPDAPNPDPVLSENPDARILVYCTKSPSARSLLAAQTLASLGYEHVSVLDGGLNAWADAGLPTGGGA